MEILLLYQPEEEAEGAGQELEDPVKFIIRTWPWTDGAEGLPQVQWYTQHTYRIM